MTPERTPFDHEAVYDEQIAPLMTQIIAICKEHKIPMFASFLYSRLDDDEGTNNFCTTLVNEDPHSKELQRCNDIVHNGLPENRLMAFRITTERAKQA